MKLRSALQVAGTRFEQRSIANSQREADNLRKVLAQYEGAKRWSPDRSYLPGFVQDPKLDATECTRSELVRKSRWFEKNDALANGLAEVFTEGTVGPYGPQITPTSSDDDWNQRASDWLYEWSPLADINTRLGYGGLMTTAAWRRFFDGEFFILKTKGDAESQGRTRPRLQGIAAHRVGTPPDKFEQEGKTIIDGVEIDARGRPVAYYIQEGVDADKYTRRTSNEVIHIFEPESPGQYRGLPILTCVLNDLHDFNDLFLFEMLAAKVQGKDAVVYETTDGATPKSSMQGIPTSGLVTGETNLTSEAQLAAKQILIQKALGGRSFAMKLGEKATFVASNRPSVTSQWFLEYYAERICLGVGVPKQIVLARSMQGTAGRGEYAKAASYFYSRFAAFSAACQQIYWFTIGTARFQDPRIADAPFDWTKSIIRPPRGLNVDVGRNATADIQNLKAGLTSREELYGMRGMDWREQMRQIAREEKAIDEIAKEFEISPDRIRESIQTNIAAPNANGGTAPVDIKGEFDAYGVGVRAGVITPNPADESYFRQRAGLPAISS